MRRCWEQVPSDRPSFSQLRDAVDELLEGDAEAHEYLAIGEEEEEVRDSEQNGFEEDLSDVFMSGIRTSSLESESLPGVGSFRGSFRHSHRLPSHRYSTDFLRVSTCSNDELLPPSPSTDQGVSSWPGPSSTSSASSSLELQPRRGREEEEDQGLGESSWST